MRAYSGYPYAFHNVVMGDPEDDALVEQQISYFNQAQVPFVWYLDAPADEKSRKRLLDHGLNPIGLFRGMLFSLDPHHPEPNIAEGCSIECVKDEEGIRAFNDLTCHIFGVDEAAKKFRVTFLKNALQNSEPNMALYLAKKEGRTVSALSTLVDRNIISLWGAATLPEMRRMGLSIALTDIAVRDAAAKGHRIGAAYLTADAMALGNLSRLGASTKWQFDVFVHSP
ncbi:MAG: GNAT family N-acetyltransferase [Verrucomicrobia bacterium]|nr:GNAT family N-acetyltransferase [Verrucomicrobiota bacterium]